MPARIILECEICKRQKETKQCYAVDETWIAKPLFDFNFPWGKEGFNPTAHEWFCSLNCMEKWVEDSPNERLLFEVDAYGNKIVLPCEITEKTKNYLRISFYDKLFDLNSEKNITDSTGNIRKQDYARIKNDATI